MAEKRTYEIETSLTLDYRKSAWGIERIVHRSIGQGETIFSTDEGGA